jgi:TolB protein
LVAGTARDSSRTIIQDLAWAHDNQSIYFSAMKVKKDYSDYKPELWTVYRYDFRSGRLQTILHSAIYVSISPDGSKLALSVNEGNRRVIYSTDRQGASPERIIDMGSKSFAPCWSPDGSKIIFNSDASGQVEIYELDLDSKVINQLTHSGGANAYNPVFSPGGKYITYYLAKGDGRDQVHMINADGSQDRNLTRDTFNNIFPGWLDKNNIIYGQGSSGQITKLYKLKINGRGKKQIQNINSFYGRVSNNDRRIAYIDNENGRIIIDKKGKAQIVQVSNLIDNL